MIKKPSIFDLHHDGEALPPRQEGWNHSEQVLVYYRGSETRVAAFSVAYYHYAPPFSEPGWIDRMHGGRIPDYWRFLPEVPRADR